MRSLFLSPREELVQLRYESAARSPARLVVTGMSIRDRGGIGGIKMNGVTAKSIRASYSRVYNCLPLKIADRSDNDGHQATQ